MAKAPTKTTTKTAATAAQPRAQATKTTTNAVPGSSPAKDAAAAATSQGRAAYDAKANAVRDAAKASGEGAKSRRFVVAEGKTLRSQGVRYFGNEAVDLPEADGQRLIDAGVLVADDKGKAAKDAGGAQAQVDDGPAPMAPGDAAPPGTPPSETDNIGDTPAGDGGADPAAK